MNSVVVALDEDGSGTVDVVPGTYLVVYEDCSSTPAKMSEPEFIMLDADTTFGEAVTRARTQAADLIYFAVGSSSTFAGSDFTNSTKSAIATFPEVTADSHAAFAVRADGLDIMRLGPIDGSDMLDDFSQSVVHVEVNGVDYKYWSSDAALAVASLSGAIWVVFRTKSVV